MKLERPDRVRIAVVALFAVLFGGVAALALRPRSPPREGPAQARGGPSTAEEHASGAGEENAPPGAPQGPSRTSAPAQPPRPPSVGDRPAPPTLPAAIAGRVVDPAGAPVEDAAIDVLPFGAARPADPFGAQGVTRSAKDGRFAIDPAPLIRGDLQVAASRVGFLEGRSARLAPASATAAPLDAGDVVVRPAGEGHLRPRFRDRDGGPVAGDALVTVVAQDGSASPARGTARFTADAQGVGRPERALTAGYYRLTARLEGFEAATVPVTIGGGGALSEPEVVLSRASGLAVQVVDDASGLPVEGAFVAWGPPGGATEAAEVETDADGRARISAPPATAIQLALRLRLEQRGWRVEGGAEGFDLARGPVLTTPPAARAETIVLRLTGGYTISGVVRDFAGRPVAGAKVVTFQGGGPCAATGTSDDGAYSLAGIDGDFATTVLAMREGFRWERAPASLSPAAPHARVDIVLGAEEAILTVRVTGPGDAPLERVVVEVSGADAANVPGVTDVGGTARIAGLGPGSVDVVASREGLLAVRRSGVVLHAGENGIDLTLAAGATISGVVVDASGAPAKKGGWVFVSRGREGGGPRDTPTAQIEPDGTFRIGGLADEPYTLAVLAPGFQPTRFPDVRPGPDPIRVTVAAALSLELLLRAPEGVPLPKRVKVTVHDSDFGMEQTFSVSAEGLVGPVEQSGATEVQVAASGYVLGSAPVPSELTEETRRIEVRLDRARTVRGRVLLPGGAPAIGAYIQATRADEGEDGQPFERVESVAEGGFTLTMAPRAAILVEATVPSTPEASGGFEGRVTIPAGNGDVEDVVIRLERRPDAEPAK